MSIGLPSSSRPISLITREVSIQAAFELAAASVTFAVLRHNTGDIRIARAGVEQRPARLAVDFDRLANSSHTAILRPDHAHVKSAKTATRLLANQRSWKPTANRR